MKDIKKPEFMLEALRGRLGFIAILEVFIALVVFFVSSIVMGIGMFPMLMGYLMSDEEFMALALNSQPGQTVTPEYMAKMQSLVARMPEGIKISFLLLEILMILIIIMYCRFVEKRKVHTMGFRKKKMATQYLVGALAGLLFFSVAYLLCLVTGSIRFQGIGQNIVPIYIVGYLAGYMIQGMAEEVLCRGYLFVSLSRRHSVIYSAVLSALFFSLLHGSNSGVSFLALVNIFLFGIFAALLLVRYENIWIVGAFHSLWNFAQGNLYGIQVSGGALQPSIIISENRSGMAFINGGNFGIEGGISVTVVFVLGILWLVHSLDQQGKLVEWKGLRPDTDEYNNQAVYQKRQQNYNTGYTQITDSQYGTGDSRIPNGQQLNTSQSQKVPTQSVKRENMGTEPGQTPWHPENALQEPENIFDANYFKD